jgi:hypothetical protein
MWAENKVVTHTVVGSFMTSCSLVDGQQKRLKTKIISSAEISEIIHQITRRLKSGHMNKHLGCREKFKSHVKWWLYSEFYLQKLEEWRRVGYIEIVDVHWNVKNRTFLLTL